MMSGSSRDATVFVRRKPPTRTKNQMMLPLSSFYPINDGLSPRLSYQLLETGIATLGFNPSTEKIVLFFQTSHNYIIVNSDETLQIAVNEIARTSTETNLWILPMKEPDQCAGVDATGASTLKLQEEALPLSATQTSDSDTDVGEDGRSEIESDRQSAWLGDEACTQCNPTTLSEFCQMFFLPKDVKPRDVWSPPTWLASGRFQGCYVYQLFAAWWQMRSENLVEPGAGRDIVQRGTRVSSEGERWTQGCGGFNCDQMGLGKTVEVFATITLNNLILENLAEVQADRKSGAGEHLDEYHGSLPKSRCPSQDSLTFACTCVRSSPTNRLHVRHGANLIVMPVGTFGAYEEFFDLAMRPKATKEHPWRLVRAHGSDTQPEALPYRWTENDRSVYLPVMNRAATQCPIQPPSSQDYLLVITTSRSLADRVLEDPKESKFHITPTLDSAPTFGLKISRLWRDEFHVEFNANTKLMATLDQILLQQRTTFGPESIFTSWFLSGTPFNTSPSDMFAYINWMRRCLPGKYQGNAWRNHHLLSEFTEDAMKRHAKQYKHHLQILQGVALKHWEKRVKKPRCGTEKERAEIKEAAKESNRFFAKLLPVFCIRRSTASTFNGYPIVALPDLIELDKSVSLPDLTRDRLESHFRSAASNGRPFSDRLKQIYSNYPALLEVMPENNHTVSGSACFYRTPFASPYAQHIDKIASSSEKLKMLRDIIENDLDTRQYHRSPYQRMERVVIATIYPATSLIIFLFLIKILGIPEDQVALYHARLDLEERTSLVKAFEDQVTDTNSANVTDEGPQIPTILIVQTTVGNAGINLQSANVMIKMEADYDYTRDAQMTKRIHRNGQSRECRVYTLIESSVASGHNTDKRYQELRCGRGNAIESILG